MTIPNGAAGSGAVDAPVWSPAVEQDPTSDAEVADVAAIAKAPVSAKGGGPQKRSTSTSALLVVAALVAFGGVGFAVGHLTTGASSSDAAQNGGAGFLPGAIPSGFPADGARGGFGGAATISGTVVSVSADSITLTLANGSTVTVATGTSTTYHNQTAGSSTDLATGQTVQVQTSGGATGANPGSSASPAAGASAGAQTTRTATDVTITAK